MSDSLRGEGDARQQAAESLPGLRSAVVSGLRAACQFPDSRAMIALERLLVRVQELTDERDRAMAAAEHAIETGNTAATGWLVSKDERAAAELRVQEAERALREIEMKPYRAEEVVARWRASRVGGDVQEQETTSE